MISRLRREFNVSVAEVDVQDVWQTAILGVVCVSNRQDYAHGLLAQVVGWIEHHRPDVQLVDYEIELL